MKTKIISFMVCAVLFAATPVFCMEAEEKPEGPFRKLPVEQKNGIFDNLYEFKDIGSGKCVSVEFYKMLEHRRKFTLTLKYCNRALHRNRRNYDNLTFFLFFADEKIRFLLARFLCLQRLATTTALG